jgi:soluble lytic murein transglycosylase
VRSAARTAWWAQRDLDDGCALMARTLFEARQLTPEDAWQEARLSVEANRPRAARAAVNLVDPHLDNTVATVLDDPIRYLTRRGAGEGRHGHELLLLALMRAAANDPDTVAGRLEDPLIHRLPLALSATAWAHVAKQAALKLLPTADDYARRAWKQWDAAHKPGTQPPWSGDLLAWHVRAALRQPAAESSRWTLMLRAVEAMSPAQQQDAAWVYWKARATLALAAPGAEGDAARAGSHAQMEALATHQGFYAKLAAEDIDGRSALPLAPAAPTVEERDVVRALPGLARALQLIGLGLRSEGTREWNFSLRGLGERELLAAAQLACERQVWDRCIGTSERMRQGFDAAQRFPMPFRESLLARAREAGIEPAVLFGLIRQESRFVADARSAVGASGLMQLMPATARGVAKKLGVGGVPDSITDPSLNLQLGAAYLKRVLDEFGGSLTMAAAAYNAGPGRPRRWREGTQAMEPAAWAESIPFNETRDYVKKVLSNSVDYAELLGVPGVTLKSRLGPAIGPREPGSATPDRTLP